MDCNHALDCVPDLDDATQRVKENPPDSLDYLRQVHEEWLNELEGLAIEAIASGDWTAVYFHIASFSQASADELQTPSADLPPTNELTND
jgi:hypothetical protein